tara:strand:+ start:147 stop:416 length:270 start_codon:yes stop_codon:yes gene_type:complete
MTNTADENLLAEAAARYNAHLEMLDLITEVLLAPKHIQTWGIDLRANQILLADFLVENIYWHEDSGVKRQLKSLYDVMKKKISELDESK